LFKRQEAILRVVDNIVRVPPNDEVKFDARPGRVAVMVPATEEYMPKWAINQVRQEPEYGVSGRLVALDLGMVKPGLLRVQGFWPSAAIVVVITQAALLFCGTKKPWALPVIGAGEATELKFAGAVTTALFGFQP